MEEICLICTLGNRDIQFKKEYKEIIGKKLNNCLNDNRDDANYLVINPHLFKPTTQKILENYEEFKEYIEIPMINKILEKYRNISKIYIIATDQNCVDENYKIKDTIYEAKIIKKIILDRYGINSEIMPAEFNAKDMEKWFNLIKGLFDTILKDDNKIVIEFSGGMSETRESIRLASLFNENITVYEIIKNEPRDMNSYFYEQSIVNEKIKDLIKNYNYIGALSFKKYYENNKYVLKLIEHLNYRLNFDFDNAINCYDEDRLKRLINEGNTIKKLEYLILELLDNMEIELKNGNYANFLARVYRLEEAMGQYFVLRWFDKTRTKISYKLKNNSSCGLIDAKNVGVEDLNNKLKSYLVYLSNGIKQNKYTNHNGVLKLRNFIEENCKKRDRNGNIITYNGNVEYYININTPTYKNLINHLWGSYSNELRIYEKIQKMYKKEQDNLRHTTIVAHGFKGINKNDFKKMLENNGVMDTDIIQYFTKLKNEFHILTRTESKNIFDEINEKIISNL